MSIDATAVKRAAASVEVSSVDEMLKLAQNALVSVVAKVSEVKPAEKILKKNKMSHVTKQDCVIGDSNSACKLVLWEDRIGALEKDKTYKFTNIAVRSYNNINYVSVVQQTEFTLIEDIGKKRRGQQEKR